MKIHLRQIPAEGAHLEGAEECALSPNELTGARCAGPLRYALDVGVSEGALWAKGEIFQPVELNCVRCLEPFQFEIAVRDFAAHLPLTGPEEIDLTPFLREDILLNLPAYPRCDRDGGRVCPAPEALRKSATPNEPNSRPTDWSALDKLKLKN